MKYFNKWATAFLFMLRAKKKFDLSIISRSRGPNMFVETIIRENIEIGETVVFSHAEFAKLCPSASPNTLKNGPKYMLNRGYFERRKIQFEVLKCLAGSTGKELGIKEEDLVYQITRIK